MTAMPAMAEGAQVRARAETEPAMEVRTADSLVLGVGVYAQLN